MVDNIYKLVSLDEAFEAIDPNEDLAFDTETVGKYGKIRLAQFYQRGWEQALIVENPDQINLLSQFATKCKNTNLVMQYAAYDISTVQAQTGSRWIPNIFSDTFLLARLAFPHLEKYSLDDLIDYVMDYDPYKQAGINKADMHKANWNQVVLPHKQLQYAAIDVYYLFNLYDKVKVQDSSLCYKLDIHALRSNLDWQNNGLPVDRERVEELMRSNLKDIESYDMPINVNSYQQVRPYINSDESDDLALARLALNGNERAAAVRKVRKLIKSNSFLNKYDTPDGRIYGRFAPSARSGRYTCSDDNLQQLPRAHKGMFGLSTNSGRVLLYSDYSQLELRSIAAITNESVIINLYKQGKDLHNYVAEMIFGKDFTKTHRQIAKTCNFNLLYGGGAKMFQSILVKDADIFLDISECKRIKRKWLRLFPAIAAWQEKGIRDYNRGTLGSTPFGRKYKAKLMTDQLNIQNQGFGSEVAKLAMHYMYPKLKELGVDLCNFVHDSYIAEMDNDEETVYKAMAIIGDSMKEAWLEATKMVQVKDMPMPVTVRAGYNWGDIEDDDFLYEYEVAA